MAFSAMSCVPRGSEFLRNDKDLDNWLSLGSESAIDPDRPIVDAHHHLWNDDRGVYDLEALLGDIGCGHNVVATVYVEAVTNYRDTGPMHMRPLGEMEFARKVADAAQTRGSNFPLVAAAIVGHADLTLGIDVQPVVEAAIELGGGRLKGIRDIAAWAPGVAGSHRRPPIPPGLLLNTRFQEGVRLLGANGLLFEAWLYQNQLDDLLALLRACPGTVVVLDHLGAPPPPEDDRSAFDTWQGKMRAVARFPNVFVKLGGLGMIRPGFDLGFGRRNRPPASGELASAWRPYIETCIDIFGPRRSMFESNFPVDRQSCGYTVLWNAFKLLAQPYSEKEKDDLFCGVASHVYGLDQTAVPNREEEKDQWRS